VRLYRANRASGVENKIGATGNTQDVVPDTQGDTPNHD